MRQDQGIKGFTLLELIVTVLIISIVSAIAYPGYSSWKKDREVRAATEKVASLIANISTLTQRGSFAYSQLLILPKGLSGVSGISTNPETIFITRGMKDNKFSKELTDNNGSTKCNADFPGNWNEFNGLQFYELYDPRASIDKVEVTTHLRSTSGSAVCFGRGGNYYKVYGSLTKSNNKNINLDSLKNDANKLKEIENQRNKLQAEGNLIGKEVGEKINLEPDKNIKLDGPQPLKLSIVNTNI